MWSSSHARSAWNHLFQKRGSWHRAQSLTHSSRQGQSLARVDRRVAQLVEVTALAGLALAQVSCVTPPLDEGLAPAETGVVSGSATVMVPLASPAPIILVLVSVSTDDAGNPDYSNLTVIPVSELGLDAATQTTVYSGNFTFPLVPEGVYVLSAVADADGNFDPVQFSMTKQLYSVGDVVGAYVMPSAESPTGYDYAPIFVEAGKETSQINVFLTTPITPPPTETTRASSVEADDEE